MNRIKRLIQYAPAITAVLILSTAAPTSWAKKEKVEFSEIKVIIEINATDGDAGFHVLGDADAWKQIQIRDPKRKKNIHGA